MAKKPTKKTPKKSPARKPASKKPIRKPAPSKSSAKKPAAASSDPRPVTTGKGAAPLEIGTRLVRDFNNGKFEINDDLWSKDIVSTEGLGVSSAWHGRKAVDAKNAWWNSTHKIHGASADGPYVGATGFAVKFRMDIEDTTSGARSEMVEIGVYSVQDGKIVREEFMYAAC
ncbi:MAG: nuclear transport factor 2 family protein [Planctomycetes bacterium]|nr:nuclear transport factor 2 family protein [Planctomycetota bacterium]